MLYLDPVSGEVIDRWRNPWTAEEVTVVHVANDQVQHALGPVPIVEADGQATLVIDVPVLYPNALAADPELAPYSPEPVYQAGEFFKLTAPAAAVADRRAAAVPVLAIAWTRIGPWLPWLKMDRPGYLVLTAHGRKARSAAELPGPIQRVIAARVPLYLHAPACVLPGRNETSWTYFARHFARYRAGGAFPVEAPPRPTECSGGAAPRAPDVVPTPSRQIR
jgi:hypothetical protein